MKAYLISNFIVKQFFAQNKFRNRASGMILSLITKNFIKKISRITLSSNGILTQKRVIESALANMGINNQYWTMILSLMPSPLN